MHIHIHILKGRSAVDDYSTRSITECFLPHQPNEFHIRKDRVRIWQSFARNFCHFSYILCSRAEELLVISTRSTLLNSAKIFIVDEATASVGKLTVLRKHILVQIYAVMLLSSVCFIRCSRDRCGNSKRISNPVTLPLRAAGPTGGRIPQFQKAQQRHGNHGVSGIIIFTSAQREFRFECDSISFLRDYTSFCCNSTSFCCNSTSFCRNSTSPSFFPDYIIFP